MERDYSASSSSGDSNGEPLPQSMSSQSPLSWSDEEFPGRMVADPSVICGMAGRFPGATSTSQLWKVLAEKRDLQRKIPEDRFNVNAYYHPQGTNKGTTNVKHGYFLDQGLDLFDNEFFRISGKEAESMDPQQRLLLEVVYEALEDAGITLDEISGTRTSVYCGSFSNDYNALMTKDLAQYPRYAATGVGNAVLSNRISYYYNLHGPSLTIDTACSSSLVCFHLGNTSLQSHESDISIVAGSALHFEPNYFVTLADFGMLSSDGRCRTFDADGTGYARGEGVCAVVLKRRSDAEAARDPIKAVVRGTGSNHDGLKNGLTIPNGEQQARLVRQTYKEAGLDTADTQYFEAHGTGTKIGDPIEAKAIGSIFASDRGEPLIVGSIKSNLGHLEGASGLAGIIKATMCVESAKILPNMHFHKPNPEIDFGSLKIQVPTELMDWPTGSGIRRASVNSFGYGGSNAHVILENYRSRMRPIITDVQLYHGNLVEHRPFLIPLTSHTEQASKILVADLSVYLHQHSDVKASDLAYSLSTRRSMHRYRSFAIGYDRDSIVKNLAEPNPTAKWTKALKGSPRVGFVFTGQGAQWHAMGRQLIEHSLVFKQTLERCDEILQRLPDSPDFSCVDELLRSEADSQLSQSLISQPVCAALQLAIVDLLVAWGIKPSAVIGHSSGEIAAAYSAGILSFENAIICAYYRGLYMSKGLGTSASPRGAMLAVGLTENEAKLELKPYSGRISLAAINSPSSLTFSGDEDAVLELQQSLDERKVFARRLRVEQAFHSHHMLPLAPGFEQALSNRPGFEVHPAKCQLFSSVTARDSSARKMDATYWAMNMTDVVRFSDALTGILLDMNDEQNIDTLIEIGAHPALQGPCKQLLKTLDLNIPYIASLSRDIPAFESLLAAAGQLFALGYPVDLAAVNSTLSTHSNGQSSTIVATGRKLQGLPTYSWDRKKFWAETRVIKEQRLRKQRHSVLGFSVAGAPGSHPRWRNYLRRSELPWLSQHVVDGKVIFPAAGYMSMAIEAIAILSPGFKDIKLRDVMFKSALTISDSDAGTEVALELEPLATSAKSTSNTWYRFVVFSFDDNFRTIEHCHGLISAEKGTPAPVETLDSQRGFAELQRIADCRRPQAAHYKKLHKLGLQYGEDFQLIADDIESGGGLAIAPLTFRPANVITTPADSCILHPTVLDASFHGISAAIENLVGRPTNEIFIPTFVRSMTVSGVLNETKYSLDHQDFWVKTETKLPGSRVAINHLSIQSDRSNDVLVDMQGFEMTALGNDSAAEEAERALFFKINWRPAFDQLGQNNCWSSFSSIADVMDTFAHQFPDSNILHITATISSTKDVLSHLGGSPGMRRRFRSITPYSHSGNLVESKKELETNWPGVIDFEEPKESQFDLVILSEHIDRDIGPLLKPDGLVIADGVAFDCCGFVEVFRSGKFSAWRKTTIVPAAIDEGLTLVVPATCSGRTRSIASTIRATYNGSVAEVTLTEFLNHPLRGQDIISLASLDEDVFFDQSAAETSQFQAIQKLLTSSGKNVVWLTSSATHETDNPAQAMILGLLRTARSENEHIRAVSFDLPRNCDIARSSKYALALLDRAIAEDEVAEREGLLLIPRMEIDEALNKKLPNPGNRQAQFEPFRQAQSPRKLALKVGKIGLLDTLAFEDDDDVIDSSDLGDDDVEIEVKASALNFRDIAAAMGIIDDYRLGDECSGVILRTGRNVRASDLKPGDCVLASRPGQGAHRSIVRNPAVLCHKLGDVSFVNATAFGAVFITAYYSLMEVARLQPGEYCLIHSAAGGVGQMAIQIAQLVGAKVIATVGSQQKRDFLKERFSLQDEMIFSSRDSSFADGVEKVTNGRGCDVALNSLAGELLVETWRCIAPFGRLIEIGKRDIHENTKLDMDPFRKNVMYASVDLITAYHHNKPLLSRLLRISMEHVAEGKIKPPGPITELPYSQAQKAFRLLQMGKYFGKVVLVPRADDMVPVLPASYRNTTLFKPDKCYLLVGGLGGIGRPLAEWMLRRGARHLAFLSRTGTDRPDAQATVDWLRARQVQVTVFRGDVADLEATTECVQSLGGSLAGVFQAAMVLRDVPYAQMALDQWRACVYPKVRGTYNLHKATANCHLDFFTCFSSGAAVIGSMAQANYAAANSYLDALMRHRRGMGLAGTTMNVGMVTGIGAVAEDAALEKTMERLGYEAISAEELFYQIEEGIAAPHSSHSPQSQVQAQGPVYDSVDDHRIITGINLQRKDLYWATKPLFRNLYGNLDLGTSAKATSSQSLPVALRNAAGVEERTKLLMDAFVDKIASVLATPASSIQAENPLSIYGLDSIVAVEFRKWFFQTVNVDVALFDIIGAQSIEALVEKVSGAMILSSTEAGANASSGANQEVQLRKSDADQSGSKTPTETFEALERPDRLPLSAFQNRMWSAHNLLDDPSALNLTITCFIRGEAQLSFLQQAFVELARRNDILRTSYKGKDSPEQLISERFTTTIQYEDLSTDLDSRSALQRHIESMRAAYLDIESGEIMRVTLAKLADSQYAIILVVHHIAIDNNSTKSTLTQFTALYDALRTGKDISLIAVPKVSYSDFALWSQNKLRTPQLQSDMQWWQENLRGAPRASALLPFAQFPRPATRRTARQILRKTVDARLLKRMKRLAAQMNATPFHFLFTAFRAYIHRHTHEDDLVILMADGNRPHPHLDDVLGYFVNVIPLRCNSSCDTSFDNLLAHTKDTVLEALAKSQIPFEAIVESAHVEPNPSHFPLGQVVVNYQMAVKAPRFETADFRVEEIVVEDVGAACEVALEAMEDAKTGLNLRLEFDSFLYGRGEMEGFFEGFVGFLASLIGDHRQVVGEVEM